MNHILGIDVSKDKVDVALSADNQAFVQAEFSNNASGHKMLNKWLTEQKVKTLHVCLEATGRYGDAIALFLYEQGHGVSIVNPSRIHAYGRSKLRRNKNDRLDAQLIADFCYSQKPELWVPAPKNQREIQELNREISKLKVDRRRKSSKLKSGITSKTVIRSLQRQIRFIDQEIAGLEEQIKQIINHDTALKEDLALLTSIPAIGNTTAYTILAEVDISSFQQASQLAAYAGLIPGEHSSGSSVHKKSKLSNVGNKHLRTAFYMPSLSASRFNPIIASLVERMTARGKSSMCILGAVMRKLLHLAFGVLKTRKPFDPHYLQNISVGG